MQYETEVLSRGPLRAREAEVMRMAIGRGMIRLLRLVVSVSSVMQDDATAVCRARVGRPPLSARRYD